MPYARPAFTEREFALVRSSVGSARASVLTSWRNAPAGPQQDFYAARLNDALERKLDAVLIADRSQATYM